VVASAFGTSKLQSHSGGTWFHAFLVGLPVVLALATGVAVAILVGSRDRGDGMPAHLWTPFPAPRGREERIYAVGRSYRILTWAFYVAMAVAAPFFAIAAWRQDTPGALIFTAVWLVLMGVGVTQWWRSSPSTLTLTGDDLRVRSPGGIERTIPLNSVSEIRWPSVGDAVTISYEGGTLNVPKQVVDIDDLIVEMRRRNSRIAFDGKWPPPDRG